MGQKNKRYVKVVFYIPEKISKKKSRIFLAVQDSSIGDIVSESLSQSDF